MMRWTLVRWAALSMAAAVFASGCHSTQNPGNSADAGQTGQDAGSGSSDAGNSSNSDAGGGRMDAGSSGSDAGSGSTDAGSGSTDGGSSGSDGGGTWPLGQCAAGQTLCDGNSVKTCVYKNGSYAWDQGTPCSGMQSCLNGQCLDNAVTITSDTELCGVHSYAGAFVVQGGAKVTCSSGDLTVSAATILVDPSSSIDLSGTGSPSKTASSSNNGGFCSQSSGSGGGGGGGGYGTQGGSGGDGINDYYNVYYGNQCMFCGGGAGGPVAGNDFDLVVNDGWPGGGGCASGYQYQCNQTMEGGAGGGSIRLLASQKITVQGKVLADGATGGSSSEGGGGGGGSGGGLLLVAPSMELSSTAVVSAAGGRGGGGGSNTCAQESPDTAVASGGPGGLGRVKILHGTDYSSQGTITGQQSESWMPPVDFSSTTHPDPSRYYNDGFTSLQVAWQQPYDGAKGTWYLLDQNDSTNLTPANGTYTTAQSVTFPASQLPSAGDWYLHVLTVNSDDSISTVSNWFRVHLNGTPHDITSSSHPDQSMWYSSPSQRVATFAWSAPMGVPSNSFVGVWYRLDHTTAPVMPDKSGHDGWTFTTNAQTLLQQDSEGNMLSDGTWYFHVVSEDTMGNLTKAVGNYQLQLGAEPAQLNFFGYVKDSMGQPVANATVGLQPYGLSATTDANGYFIFNDVYEESYTLSVGDHFSTAVQVAPNTVPYNVVLH